MAHVVQYHPKSCPFLGSLYALAGSMGQKHTVGIHRARGAERVHNHRGGQGV